MTEKKKKQPEGFSKDKNAFANGGSEKKKNAVNPPPLSSSSSPRSKQL